MEELPTDVRIVVVEENKKVQELIEKIDKLLDASPTLEMLSVVRDSLLDIRNIMEVQNQRLEKLDSLSPQIRELYGVSESLAGATTHLESSVNAFRAKTHEIENATRAMEDKALNLNEAAFAINSLSSAIEQKNSYLLDLTESLTRLAERVEEKSSGLISVIESYNVSREELERSASLLSAIQENIRDMRSDIFERNQYLSVILSDFTLSKETMEKSIKLLEEGALNLKATVEEMDKRTDDILNVTMRKVGDLQNLRDALYDDIASVDDHVKKVQKAADRQNKKWKKRDKKQTELLNLVKKISTRVNKFEKQMRRKKK